MDKEDMPSDEWRPRERGVMANNVTTTEERRAMGVARANRTCEICGGQYEQSPTGRLCGAACQIPVAPTAAGPYTPRKSGKPRVYNKC